MASPNDSQDVKYIKKPRKIIPLIKNGGVACVADVNVEDTKLCLSANAAAFDLPQNVSASAEEQPCSDPVEEEIRAEFLKHIEELKLKKAGLLIELAQRVRALLDVRGSDLEASLKKEIIQSTALIRECDDCIAMVRARQLKRDNLSLTLAAQEQNPDNNLVRFAPAKPFSSALSSNRHTFFGAHRPSKKPETLSSPKNGLEPTPSRP